MESTPPASAPANSPARLLLKAVVLVGAVAFLAIMMINACAHPPEAFYPTKAAPVMRSPATPRIDPPGEQQPPQKRSRRYMPATKAGPAFAPDDVEDVAQQAPAPQQPPAPQKPAK